MLSSVDSLHFLRGSAKETSLPEAEVPTVSCYITVGSQIYILYVLIKMLMHLKPYNALFKLSIKYLRY